MKECIIFGGGGGQALGFEIKNGSTAPASPKENTIWVKSSTAIPSWDFSPVQPQGTAAGQVWFKTGSTGDATINALKKNGIWLPIDGCKQYVNGVWTSKEAQVYQGGAWTEIVNSLYLITAGVGLASGYSITNVNGGSTVVNADKSISFKGASSANAYQYLSPGIDVTHYSTMHVRVKGSTVCSYGLGTASALSASVTGAQDNVEETLSLDVSKLSGTYYPAVHTNLYSADVTTTVYEWWFE